MEADTKLMLIGIGELEQQMRRKVEELGIADKIMFLGARTDMPDLYQAMDLFLLPSLFEGFGIVYAEAQCAGLPCLASKDAVPPVAKITDLLEFLCKNRHGSGPRNASVCWLIERSVRIIQRL